MSVEEYFFPKEKSTHIENELNRISREWCRMNRTFEFSFAFGKVDFNNFDEARYFLCKHKNRIVGFITYFPIFGKNSYYLDLTRRGKDAPRGTIDYLKAFLTGCVYL